VARNEAGPGNSPETRVKQSSSNEALQQTLQTVEAVDQSWRQGVLETLGVLREWFPAAFAGRPRPLKVGIHKDLIERAPAITPVEIARALGYHTKSNGYLLALKPGAPRVDLDGDEVGAVTDGEAVYAKGFFDARKKRAAKQSAATPASPQVADPTPVVEPPPPPSPAPTASEPPKTKQQPDLEQAKADRERWRRSRGLGVRA